jgi:hypothetical protein
MEKEKEADIIIKSSVRMNKVNVYKAGKVEIKFVSNQKWVSKDEGKRINMPPEIKDGDIYVDAEIHSINKGSLVEEDIIKSIDEKIEKLKRKK